MQFRFENHATLYSLSCTKITIAWTQSKSLNIESYITRKPMFQGFKRSNCKLISATARTGQRSL